MAKKKNAKKAAEFMDAPAAIEKGEARLVVLDPTSNRIQIVPEHGQLLTIDYYGQEKTFLFVDNGEEMNCDRCIDKTGNCSGDVCSRVDCGEHNVSGIEYVLSEDGEFYVPKEEPKPESKDDEKRSLWETTLRELEEKAREHEFKAEELKRDAKTHSKAAEKIRAKLFEILTGGSENYQSDTPLFDILDDDLLEAGETELFYSPDAKEDKQ